MLLFKMKKVSILCFDRHFFICFAVLFGLNNVTVQSCSEQLLNNIDHK